MDHNKTISENAEYMNFIKKLSEFLLQPFCKNFVFFVYIFSLCSLVDILSYCYNGNVVFALYLGMHGFILCYFTCLFINLTKSESFSQWMKIILVVFGWVNLGVDLMCQLKLHTGFSDDMVGIIFATNKQEVGEFINTFFSFDIILYFIGFICLIWGICRIAGRYSLIGYKLRYVLFLIVVIGCVVTVIKKSTNWGRIFFLKPMLFMTYELPPPLGQYYTDLDIKTDSTRMPDNICIIIGESFSKKHSSLYGYEKDTNPKLGALEKDSSLLVYKHVTSPGTHTIESLQKLMSTFGINQMSQKKWYEHSTLIEILSKSGYKTHWISNQSQKGMYDNVASRFSELCDTAIFVNKYSGTNVYTYDETILPILSALRGRSRNVYFIHLMGSHYEFDKRYPSDFTIFRQDDYMDYPKHQRYNLATYDNSIRYNDSIVSEIIMQFEDEESVVYYFSDHGLDVYNSSENYVGHATGDPMSVEAGTQIPFVMWMSKKYMSRHGIEYERIRHRLDSIFNMRIFVSLLMQDVGIEISDLQ